MNTMRILFYGDSGQCDHARDRFRGCARAQRQEHRQVQELDQLCMQLVDWEPGLAVVLADGADGAECVRTIRSNHPNLPVFWFSDCDDFAVQSYQLNCSYFAVKPITEEKIHSAFHRCDHMGIRMQA